MQVSRPFPEKQSLLNFLTHEKDLSETWTRWNIQLSRPIGKPLEWKTAFARDGKNIFQSQGHIFQSLRRAAQLDMTCTHSSDLSVQSFHRIACHREHKGVCYTTCKFFVAPGLKTSWFTNLILRHESHLAIEARTFRQSSGALGASATDAISIAFWIPSSRYLIFIFCRRASFLWIRNTDDRCVNIVADNENFLHPAGQNPSDVEDCSIPGRKER